MKLDGNELNPETNELVKAGGLPDMVKVLLPSMTNTQFERFKNDKSWLSQPVLMCQVCHKQIKNRIELQHLR